MQYLDDFYKTHDEQARFEPKSGQVEFLTTLHCIQKYLFPGAKILEIGAGTGRYSHFLAQRGYEVHAVELLSVNLEKLKALTQPNENLTVYQGNALSVPFLPDEYFDIVLLLGPMYHLYTEQDKQKALTEAIRLTQKGGILMIAYCLADAAILMQGFIKGNYRLLVEKKLLDPDTFQTHSEPEDLFELYTVQEIDRLAASIPAKRLQLVGTDLSAQFLKETIDNMDKETFDAYMKYHFTVCERKDLIGAGNHALDILKKE